MFWVFLQVILAFGLGVFIVWWSLPRKKKRDETGDKKD
jgi:hypothetical protein